MLETCPLGTVETVASHTEAIEMSLLSDYIHTVETSPIRALHCLCSNRLDSGGVTAGLLIPLNQSNMSLLGCNLELVSPFERISFKNKATTDRMIVRGILIFLVARQERQENNSTIARGNAMYSTQLNGEY